MRDKFIVLLKRLPIFPLIKSIYMQFNRAINFHKRYASKEFRISHYRKLIDKYLKNTTSNNHNDFITQLEKEISKRSKHLINIQPNWWVALFRVVGSERECKKLDKYVDVLENETLKLPFSRNSSFALLEIYALLIEYGLYGVGCVIRSRCAQVVIQEGIDDKSSQKSLERFFSAAFEENDKDKINSTFNLLRKMSEDSSELLLLGLLFNNNHDISKDVAIDKDYLNLIKGKRIAIVGPSQIDTQNGNEIDDFDLVVRFNYKGDDLTSSKYIGSRTDISYFNGANTRDLENKYKEVLTEALKAIVFKVPVNTSLFGCKCIRQMLLPLEHCMLDNSPNALPNVILDLLLYQPLEIKIFNIDMQLSSLRSSSYGVMNKNFWDNFYPKAGHDPFSQFHFIQTFYKNNIIKVDRILKEIIELEISKYMWELQNAYLDRALFTDNV